ncbi:MAG: F0F1 ATP synthase subunit epsilon [Caldisericia bacterium]|nr:F0F1 ATP synthase subunit epsilon [Caldisericia bacterium]
MNFRIILPEGKTYSEETESVIVPLSDGLAGIMKGHSPVLAELKDGVISVRNSENKKLVTLYKIYNAMIEVLDDQITVLADKVTILTDDSNCATVV